MRGVWPCPARPGVAGVPCPWPLRQDSGAKRVSIQRFHGNNPKPGLLQRKWQDQFIMNLSYSLDWMNFGYDDISLI